MRFSTSRASLTHGGDEDTVEVVLHVPAAELAIWREQRTTLRRASLERWILAHVRVGFAEETALSPFERRRFVRQLRAAAVADGELELAGLDDEP